MTFGLLPPMLKAVITFITIVVLIFICVRLSYIYSNYINTKYKKAGSAND